MAEIPIQEKKSRSMLPLLLALLVVVALIWYFMSYRNKPETAPAGVDSTKTGASPTAPAVMAVHFLGPVRSSHGEQA